MPINQCMGCQAKWPLMLDEDEKLNLGVDLYTATPVRSPLHILPRAYRKPFAVFVVCTKERYG